MEVGVSRMLDANDNQYYTPYVVRLNDYQIAFLEKLAEHDGLTVGEEIQGLLNLQIEEEIEVQKEFEV